MTNPAIRISLLGVPSVTDGTGNPLSGLGLGKPLGMLAYLCLKGESRREELVTLFWGSLPEQKAKNAFRQTLHRLRAAVGEDRLPLNSTTVKLELSSAVWVDVLVFDQLLKRGAIDDALELYRGPLLDGLDLSEPDFDQWVMSERSRLDARYQWALQQAVNAASTRGDIHDATAKAALLSKASPLAADAAISEASVLVAAGRMAEARASLERFSERYRSELGSDAPTGVREMLSRLRKQSTTQQDVGGSNEPAYSFFGRERELGRLLSAWTEVRNGNGATVTVSGDDGIGKSALVEEFVSRAGRLGQMLTLVGRERSGGSMIPYASIGRALRGALNAPGLSGASQHLLAEAARLLPELRDQFDLPALKPIDDDASRLRFYEGVAALIDAIAYEQPVLILLEDFHNSAPATAQLVEYLSGRLAGVSVMFCMLYRPATVRPALAGSFPFTPSQPRGSRASIDSERGIERIELGPMSPDETAALIHSVADSDVVPDEERRRIAGLSGGIPYRALELARQAAGGLNPTGVPATLKDALWARLQGCSPPQQRLFVACALLERAASIRLLAAASHLSEAAALDAVLALEGLGLVTQTPQGVKPGHDEAAALALEGTGPAGRALLAGWAADALTHEPGARNAELAHLFSVAGNAAATFEHSVAAAYDAAAVGAMDSVRHFTSVAQQFVSTPADRKKLETLARLFELGRPRLGSGEPGAIDVEQTSDEAVENTDERAVGEPGRPNRRRSNAIARIFAGSSVFRIATATTIAMALIAMAMMGRGSPRRPVGMVLTDSLFLTSRSALGLKTFYLTGQIIPGVTVPHEYTVKDTQNWEDSIRLPLMNPRTSPTGAQVAVEKMTDGGPDIYLFTSDGRQSRRLVFGSGDDIIGGWSPDGAWLLATHGQTLPGGNYDSDLFALSSDGTRRIAIDTAVSRSVVESAWSPSGSYIAWTARTGDTHQQEIFISNADGTDVRNVSNSDAEDYHVAWAPDGDRLAFTSDRLGNAEVFVYDILTTRLVRLTWDPAQDDHAVFSPDGNFVAFESTRGGDASVFVTRSWGSSAVKVSGAASNFTIARWGASALPPRFIHKVQIRSPLQIGTGDSTEALMDAYDKSGAVMTSASGKWLSLDPEIARVIALDVDSSDGTPHARAMITGVKPGLARIALSAGGWRVDTALIQVGSARAELVSDNFSGGILSSRWQSVGDPAPRTILMNGGSVLSPHSGRQIESGLLSKRDMPLRTGFTARVRVHAPFSAPISSRSFSVSLVATDSTDVTQAAPRMTRILSIEWLGQAARVAYSVDREQWTEPVTALGGEPVHAFEIKIEEGGRVAFFADGKLRWRSTLRMPSRASRARLWLGSQGAGDDVLFDDVAVALTAGRPTGR